MIITGAIIGWLIARFFIWLLFHPYSPKKIAGFRYEGILSAVKPLLTEKLSLMAREADLAGKIDTVAVSRQLLPEIEDHVDEFLSTKLKEAFPLLSNFMGEKTLSKFREAFMQEAEQKLPGMLQSFVAKFADNVDAGAMIENRINNISIQTIETNIKKNAGKQLRLLQVTGALLGTLGGGIQAVLLYSLQQV
ncbi:MAG: DUF445 family protein [Ferruginibacter sp.]